MNVLPDGAYMHAHQTGIFRAYAKPPQRTCIRLAVPK